MRARRVTDQPLTQLRGVSECAQSHDPLFFFGIFTVSIRRPMLPPSTRLCARTDPTDTVFKTLGVD